MKRKLTVVLLILCMVLTFVPVTGYAADGSLNLSKTEMELELAYYYLDSGRFYFDSDYVTILDENVTPESVEVDNPGIVSIDRYDNIVSIKGLEIGSTNVTITGSNGKKGTVKVTVPEPKIKAFYYQNEEKIYKDSFYYDSFTPNEDSITILFDGVVTDVASEDESVLTFKKEEYSTGGVASIEFIPHGAGKTNLKLTDYYGKTRRIPVEFTEKGADEARYMRYINWNFPGGCDVWEGQSDIGLYLTEENRYEMFITEDDIKKARLSVKGNNVNITDVKGTRHTIGDEWYYIIAADLGRKMKWKESFDVTLSIGKASKTVTFVAKREIPESDISVTISDLEYNGKYRKPKATVKYKSTALTLGTDYNGLYSDNKDVGTAYLYLYTPPASIYYFRKDVSFKINPKGTTLKTPSKGKTYITVKWNKQSERMSSARITGYQIQLATDSKFTKNKKLIKVKGYSNTSKKIEKLKSKTTYYMRVRTYKVIGKKTYYSKWSAYKKAKTN